MKNGSGEPASVNGVPRPREWGRQVPRAARLGLVSPPKNPLCLAAICPKKGQPPARRRRALGVGRAGQGSGTVKPAW